MSLSMQDVRLSADHTSTFNWAGLKALFIFAIPVFFSGCAAVGEYGPVFEEPGIHGRGDFFTAGDGAIVNHFGGNLIVTATDVDIPSQGGFSLNVQRTWNSTRTNLTKVRVTRQFDSPLGLGWIFHYGVLWKSGPAGRPEFIDSTGARHIFYLHNQSDTSCTNCIGLTNEIPIAGSGRNNTWISSELGILIKHSSNHYTLHTKSGLKLNLQRSQANYAYLVPIEISDIDGNTWDVKYIRDSGSEYVEHPMISEVEDGNNRTLKFEYFKEGSGHRRLSAVKLGTTKLASYDYVSTPGNTFLREYETAEGRKTLYDTDQTSAIGQGGYDFGKIVKITIPTGGVTSFGYQLLQLHFDSPIQLRDVYAINSITRSGQIKLFNYIEKVDTGVLCTEISVDTDSEDPADTDITLIGEYCYHTYDPTGHCSTQLWKVGLLASSTDYWGSSSRSRHVEYGAFPISRDPIAGACAQVQNPVATIVKEERTTRDAHALKKTFSDHKLIFPGQVDSDGGISQKIEYRNVPSDADKYILGQPVMRSTSVGGKLVDKTEWKYQTASGPPSVRPSQIKLYRDTMNSIDIDLKYHSADGKAGAISSKTVGSYTESYDYENGVLSQIKYPIGSSMTREILANGRIKTQTNNNVTTDYTWDDDFRLESIVGAPDAEISIEYQDVPPQMTTSRSDSSTVIKYDDYGRWAERSETIDVVSGAVLGVTTSSATNKIERVTAYDIFDRPIEKVMPSGAMYSIRYDVDDRITSYSATGDQNTFAYATSASGETVTHTKNMQLVRVKSTDFQGRITFGSTNGNSVTYSYGPVGSGSSCSPSGSASSSVSGGGGSSPSTGGGPTSLSAGSSGSSSSSGGGPTSSVSGSIGSSSSSGDSASSSVSGGGPTSLSAGSSGSGISADHWVQLIDPEGQQCHSFTTDLLGNRVAESHPESGVTTYRYSAEGWLIGASNGNEDLSYAMDARGRVESMSHNGSVVTTNEYHDDFNVLAQSSYAGVTLEYYNLDGKGRPKTIAVSMPRALEAPRPKYPVSWPRFGGIPARPNEGTSRFPAYRPKIVWEEVKGAELYELQLREADNAIDENDCAASQSRTHSHYSIQAGLRLAVLSLQRNQVYCYRVRALKWTREIGPFSPWIAIKRLGSAHNFASTAEAEAVDPLCRWELFSDDLCQPPNGSNIPTDNTVRFEVELSYDEFGRLNGIKYPEANTFWRSETAVGRWANWEGSTGTAGGMKSLTYEMLTPSGPSLTLALEDRPIVRNTVFGQNGAVESMDIRYYRGNGVAGHEDLGVARAFDSLGRITSWSAQNAGGVLYSAINFNYSPWGMLESYRRDDPALDSMIRYDYGETGLLNEIQIGSDKISYTYDAAGNLTNLGGTTVSNLRLFEDAGATLTAQLTKPSTGTIGYDDNNRPIDAGWDERGRVTRTSEFGFRYNELNRLAFINSRTSNSFELAHFLYDANGQRVREVFDNTVAYSIRLPNGQLIAKQIHQMNNQFIRRPIREDYLFHNGESISTVRYVEDRLAEAQIEIRDWQGTPVTAFRGSAADPSPTTPLYYEYSPYGTQMRTEAYDRQLQSQFTGHERDNVVGMDYMLARHYIPEKGRFLTPDLVTDVDYLNPVTFNLYAYARGNPVTYVDPDGQDAWETFKSLFGFKASVKDGPVKVSRSPDATSGTFDVQIVGPVKGVAGVEVADDGKRNVKLGLTAGGDLAKNVGASAEAYSAFSRDIDNPNDAIGEIALGVKTALKVVKNIGGSAVDASIEFKYEIKRRLKLRGPQAGAPGELSAQDAISNRAKFLGMIMTGSGDLCSERGICK